ncbi:MAG: hypothetical protein NC911_05450 [Candidatus Omnitrophica bacterium]|nr:hypothetical protein [Candidatus Omnitrophota bacterium]
MTSRERVLAAVRHQKTDRTPANYMAHQEVTERLKQRLGIVDDEELLRALQIDFRRIQAPYYLPETGPDADGYFINMWGLRYRKESINDNLPKVVSPFNENTTLRQVENHPWPDAGKLDYSSSYGECQKYHPVYATYGAPWSPFFHEVGWLIGQENLFIWMYTKPEVVQLIIQRIVDFETKATEKFLTACRGLLDITYFGNDFGTQRGLVISPEHWEKFFRRPLKQFFDLSHDFGCKVMFHSCGSVRAIIPSLIEDGLDILEPVQTAAVGMDLPSLVRDFSHLSFHGGISTQTTLPFGTKEQVQNEVRSFIRLTREKGGYILGSSQELIEDIPLENILTMYDVNLRI